MFIVTIENYAYLIPFQRKAVEDGLPYQVLISSILHKYANGNVIEKRV